MAPTVLTSQAGRVLEVRLDNPPHNFMTTAMVVELEALVERLEDDATVGAVIITGAPENLFITHFDVGEIERGASGVGVTVSPGQAGGTLRAVGAAARIPGARGALARTPASGMTDLLQIHDVFVRMNRLDKVLIAAVNGPATGGGCELALACDLRYMADGDFRIGLPEMTLGITPGAGGTQRLTRTLGAGRALEMMLEGALLHPREALEIGLVHRVVAQNVLLDEARATAERLARRNPVAVGALKRSVYEGTARSLAAGLHAERAGFLAAASTDAARRAMAAYAAQVERLGRPPLADDETLRSWQDGTAIEP